MNSKISDKDKKDWEKFITSGENLPDKESNIKDQKIKKIRTFDLHGYSLDEANQKIEELITHSYNSGITKLTIVTGKGLHSNNEKNPYVSKDLGILKYSVRDFITCAGSLLNMIKEVTGGREEDGGGGAFVICL